MKPESEEHTHLIRKKIKNRKSLMQSISNNIILVRPMLKQKANMVTVKIAVLYGKQINTKKWSCKDLSVFSTYWGCWSCANRYQSGGDSPVYHVMGM